MSITFKQIEAFRAVMLTGTTTEAAKLLSVTQPAISRLLADMEADIGYQLFSREGRRLAPTAEAKLLVEEVNRALIGLEHIREAALEIGQSRYSRLRLVSVPLAASNFAVELVAEFSKQNPGTGVTLEVMSSDAAVEWVLTQQCDLGIASGIVTSPAIDSCTLKTGVSACIVPPGHAFEQAREITPTMLEGQSFISYCRDSSYRRQLDAIIEAEGVHRTLSLEARTTDAICAMVAAGLGISVVGPVSNDGNWSHLGGGRVIAIPFHPGPEVGWSLIWPTHRALSATAKVFLDVARSM